MNGPALMRKQLEGCVTIAKGGTTGGLINPAPLTQTSNQSAR